jgi:hypothetical protein
MLSERRNCILSAFTGLYWKELKIASVDFFIALGLMMLIFIAAFSAAQYYEQPFFMAVPFFFVYILHFGYLPLFLFSSLRWEGKTQLWLHNPHSSVLLFSAKLAAGLTYYFISLSIAFLAAYWSVDQVMIPALSAEYNGHGLKELLLIAVFMTALTIYYAIWLQFYWCLYHALKNIPYLKKIRALFIFVVWFVVTMALNIFRNLPLYEKLNDLGVMKMEVLQEVSFEANRTAVEVLPTMGTIDISIVTVMLYFLVTAIVFFLSIWLLERKVEV